jgi:hypothetical protein
MNHLAEWKASCVDEKLTQLNVVSLAGDSPSEYLLYSDAIPRRNDGRIGSNFLQLYSHTIEGGWWCSGIDLLTGKEDIWGCFKPDLPRHNYSDCGKTIKYEHPPKTPTGLFALKVPVSLWEKIAARYKIKLEPTDIDPSLPDSGFWQWAIAHRELPICITEGAKKAGTLLSAGYAAVALPGIHSGYRTPKDELGNRIGKSHLIPQLQKLALPNREIYLVFDRDSKPNTVKAVNAAIKKNGYLLQQAGCKVKVVVWDEALGKGVDDLVAKYGTEIIDRAYDNALSLETWKAKAWNRLTYKPQIEVNLAYLPNLDLSPAANLIAIKSAKGTGKTEFLANMVQKALLNRQKVLVIGHRVQLVKALCQRFGLPYITEVGDLTDPNLSYGLCIDSLHPNSQAQFNAVDWSNCTVIIDEVEQVLWHGLNSTTCKDYRVAILKSFKTLIQNVLTSKGRVLIADADLSDIGIDYLRDLSSIGSEPYIIYNEWQPNTESAWQVYNYNETTPKKLVKDLEKHIKQGGKPLVCLSAQKLSSHWSTQTLEAYLHKKFPQAKILRIDSESLADPNHPAYSCITNFDRVLAKWDIVLASPSIETGISIDLKNHFTSVWAIAQGVQSENAVRQTLARLRTNVPRYIWCATYSFNKIGNGSTSIPALITSGHRLTQLNIRLLQQSDLASFDDIDTGFQAESLLCWAKMAVRYNANAINYRESILEALRAEGHQIFDANILITKKSLNNEPKQTETTSLVEAITEIRTENYQAECRAIANALPISEGQYHNLKKCLIKSPEDRHKLRKYELQQRYHLPVTPELVALDDDGWYQKIRLHYFLTIGRNFLVDRDARVAYKLIDRGHGSLFLPDFNDSQLGAIVGTMEVLGIPCLLANPQRELRNDDPDLQAMARIALDNRKEIKTAVGIGIAKNSSPVLIIRRFLEKIDYSLKYIRCDSQNKGRKRIRIYQILQPNDRRETVFEYWLTKDFNRPGSSLFWEGDRFKLPKSSVENSVDSDYLQLSLNI